MHSRTGLFLPYWLSLVCCVLNNIVEAMPRKSPDTLTYLENYGYLKKPTEGDAQEAQDLRKSLKDLQRFAGLKETGELDNDTIKLMNTPRCGDKDPVSRRNRKRRYAVEGSRWRKKEITFRILNDPYRGPTSPKYMPPELIRKTIKAALQKWSFATSLTFKEKKEGEADIMIKFIGGNHNDGYNFDGRGGSLAHAFYPSNNKGISGDAHFDVDEKFSLTESDSTNFIWVTTHEFGHSLGLRHSDVKEAIMFPWYTTGRMGDVVLGHDDRKAIQHLYGKPPKHRKFEKKIDLPTPPRPECKMSFSATFHDKHRKKVFGIKDYEYFVFNENGKSKGPKEVRKHWKGLSLKVLAAYTRNDGHTVFFTQYRYYIYDGTRLVEGPDFIEKYGLTKDLRDMDAAIVFPGNGDTYFFKDDKYWKFDDRKRKIYSGYPKSIVSYWRGLPNDIDTALQTPNGDTYFFKGNQFYKFDAFSFSVLPSYPKPIGPYWLGCREDFFAGDSSSLGLRASNTIVFITVLWIMLCN